MPATPERGRRASGWLLAGPALAAAAALALWLSSPPGGSLTRYQIEIAGVPQPAPAEHSSAGSSAELELARGSGVTIVLRPQGRVEPVEASVFVAAAGSAAGPRAVPFSSGAAGSGALRVQLAAGALPERGRLVVIVGRAGAMPRGPDTGSAQYGRGWQRFDIPFLLVTAATPKPVPGRPASSR
jgi:hypothetical protein